MKIKFTHETSRFWYRVDWYKEKCMWHVMTIVLKWLSYIFPCITLLLNKNYISSEKKKLLPIVCRNLRHIYTVKKHNKVTWQYLFFFELFFVIENSRDGKSLVLIVFLDLDLSLREKASCNTRWYLIDNQ